jgi:hypothetical protein
MFLSKQILIALPFTGSVNAAVANLRTSPERRDTQSCHCTDHGFFQSYSVLIRVPYGGKADCDATYNALENGGPWSNDCGCHQWSAVSISNWQCVNKGGNIQLWFNSAEGSGSDINAALESRYPSVDRFNCPDY